jgi:hypothetical protein
MYNLRKEREDFDRHIFKLLEMKKMTNNSSQDVNNE